MPCLKKCSYSLFLGECHIDIYWQACISANLLTSSSTVNMPHEWPGQFQKTDREKHDLMLTKKLWNIEIHLLSFKSTRINIAVLYWGKGPDWTATVSAGLRLDSHWRLPTWRLGHAYVRRARAQRRRSLLAGPELLRCVRLFLGPETRGGSNFIHSFVAGRYSRRDQRLRDEIWESPELYTAVSTH